jgi:hypothetical protein
MGVILKGTNSSNILLVEWSPGQSQPNFLEESLSDSKAGWRREEYLEWKKNTWERGVPITSAAENLLVQTVACQARIECENCTLIGSPGNQPTFGPDALRTKGTWWLWGLYIPTYNCENRRGYVHSCNFRPLLSITSLIAVHGFP